MSSWRLALAFVVLSLSSSAQALTVGGWEVDPQPDKDGDCTAVRTYKDEADGNAENTVVLVFGKDNSGSALMSITFAYDKWTREKGDVVKADLIVDNTVEQRDIDWKAASKTVLVALFHKPDDLLSSMSRGSKLALRYAETGKSDGFSTPDIGQAIGAAAVCRNLIK